MHGMVIFRMRKGIPICNQYCRFLEVLEQKILLNIDPSSTVTLKEEICELGREGRGGRGGGTDQNQALENYLMCVFARFCDVVISARN